MTKYKAIVMFKDLKTGKMYHPGDTYVGDRADELSGPKNKLGRPLIAAVKADQEPESKPKAKRKKADPDA